MSSQSNESELIDRVEVELLRAEMVFRREVYIHGIQTDFVVMPSYGRMVVLEIENWEATPGNLERAATQARIIEEGQVNYFTSLFVNLPVFVPLFFVLVAG